MISALSCTSPPATPVTAEEYAKVVCSGTAGIPNVWNPAVDGQGLTWESFTAELGKHVSDVETKEPPKDLLAYHKAYLRFIETLLDHAENRDLAGEVDETGLTRLVNESKVFVYGAEAAHAGEELDVVSKSIMNRHGCDIPW